MSYILENINYIEICGSIEKGDEYAATVSLVNSLDSNSSNNIFYYNLTNVLCEALEISLIFKQLRGSEIEIGPELLRVNEHYSTPAETQSKQIITDLFVALNKLKNLDNNINDDHQDDNRAPTLYSDLLEILEKLNHIFHPETFQGVDEWKEEIWKTFSLFSLKLEIMNAHSNPNDSNWKSWLPPIIEVFNICIQQFNAIKGNVALINVENNNFYKLFDAAMEINNTLEVLLVLNKIVVMKISQPTISRLYYLKLLNIKMVQQ